MNLSKPLVSGGLFVVGDSYFRDGQLIPQDENALKRGAEQAACTYASPLLLNYLEGMGLSVPLDRQFSEPLVTAGLYIILNKMMGSDYKTRQALLSGGAAFAAEKLVGLKNGPALVTGTVVPSYNGRRVQVS